MAINMGLTAKQRRSFEALLLTHHHIEIGLQLLDLDHHALGQTLSTRLVDGQVTVDWDQAISRSLELDLLDPTGALHLDSKSPDDGALFADRMVQVRYSVIDPMWTKRYTTPVFTGPITKLERNGVLLKVEAQGKEVFGLTPAWNARTFKKGVLVTSAIKFIVGNIMGESAKRMRIPNLKAKLPRNVSVGGTDKLPWQVAQQLANSVGYQLFYDGNGICQMRRIPSTLQFTFRENESIKTQPDVGFAIDNVINAVEVWGKKPKKPKKGHTAKKRPHARVVAARSHPLSPWSLGRSGGPRYLPRVIENDNITTDKQANDVAKRELAHGLLESVEVAYDTLVIPHLEEMDIVRCATTKFAGNHRLRKMAIPLTAGGSQTVGYVRNVKPNLARFRMRAKYTKKARKK